MMQVKENISLRPYNSFGIDATAKYFAEFSSLDDLQEILSNQQSTGNSQIVLGGGSNILLTKNVDGIVLKNELKGIELIKEDTDHYYVKAGAGEVWHSFVLHCINNNYAGVENLSLIPGCVGAGPMQNIGAYGVEIKDVVEEVEAYHIHDKIIQKFSAKDCEFGYRESIFKRKYKNRFVILNVSFRLCKQPVFHTSYGAIEEELKKMQVTDLSIKNISQAVINIRSSKLPDPHKIGNAGSFFKNPEINNSKFNQLKKEFPAIIGYAVGESMTKLAAGWMIEQCGWKGFREGDAGVHANQSLVLVNYGNATGEQLFILSKKIVESVQQKFGVTLEREVNII